MEFIEAPSLKTLLRSRRLGVDEALALGRFLLAACQYLLQFDLVHGDLKRRTSCGLGLRLASVQARGLRQRGGNLFGHLARGHSQLLAPERLEGAPIPGSARRFCHRLPFTKRDLILSLWRNRKASNAAFSCCKTALRTEPEPYPFEAVLLRSLSTRPELRYQNYSEMLFELEHSKQVRPFHSEAQPLLERDPLRFYETGFFVLLAFVVLLLLLLLRH